MHTPLVRGCVAVLAAAALAACNITTVPSPGAATPVQGAPSGSWLQGSVDERLETVAGQLRGFGATMLEVDHRYSALYFAGQDRNWEFAAYQMEEMAEALEHGLQRRPARAANATMLEPALGAVQAAVEARDPGAFDASFAQLTATCNACHGAEDVAFIHVATPTQRPGSVQAVPAAATAD